MNGADWCMSIPPNPKGTLILICGLPGSGKTTLARQMETERNAIRLCPDEWIEQILADPLDKVERDRLRDPIENLQWSLAQTFLQQGFTVILENGFWGSEERDAYALGALGLGARIELHYLEASSEELWQRILRRSAQLSNPTFIMTREELEEGWRLFQPPTSEELDFYDNPDPMPSSSIY
ncbi:MAG: ATP-binding protein [Chlorobia bacterium]|nr:ATP-binding protein [Fimbriimonadaceae bacterium]